MPRLPAHVLVETNLRGPSVAAILGPMGVISADTPLFSADAEAWIRHTAEKNKSFAFVIQMDSSPDRAYAAGHLSSLFPAANPTLLAQQWTVETLKNQQDALKNNPLVAGLEATHFGLDPLSVRWPRPVMAFSQAMTFHWETTTAVLRSAPATSPGACWLHLPAERLLFVGDCVSLNLPPLLHEARFEDWLATLAELKRAPYKDCRLFCSHGGWIDAEGVMNFTNFVRAAQRRSAAIREKTDPAREISQAGASLLEFFSVSSDRREFALRRLQTGLHALWERDHAPLPEKTPGP